MVATQLRQVLTQTIIVFPKGPTHKRIAAGNTKSGKLVPAFLQMNLLSEMNWSLNFICEKGFS